MEADKPRHETKKKSPPAQTYLCKVCGKVNKFVPGRRRVLICARCGYKTRDEDHRETL